MEASFSEEFDKDGFIWKRNGSSANAKRRIGQKKWKFYYINLIGGAIHYYKDFEDQDPKGSIKLNELKLFKDDKEGSSQKFCFALRNDTHDYLFYLDEENDYKDWIEAIEKSMNKESRPPLKKEKRKTRAQELAYRLKKNTVGKAATSALGKKALRSQAPEEVKNLIASLKHIIEKDTKSPKKAAEIEDNLFKIGVKAYFLIDAGKCKFDELLAADKPVRQALEILSKCHDHAKYSRNPNPKLLEDKFAQVQKLLSEAAAILTNLLSPHMKAKNAQRIKDTTDYLGNPERLMRIFQDDSLNDDLQELISAGEHYTQFHFYSEK